MKRITVIIMALLCGAFLFAETGYAGTQWNSPIWKIVQEKGLQTIQPEFEGAEHFMLCYYQKKNILGELNNIYYENFGGNINTIFYITNACKTPEIKQKIKKSGQEYYSTQTYEIEKDESLTGAELKDKPRQKAIDYLLMDWAMTLAREATMIEYDPGNITDIADEPDKEKAKSTLYIYDYNDDTRLYLFENIIKDKAVVVYVPHEQDY